MDRIGVLFAVILLLMIVAFLIEPLRRLFTRSKWDVFVSHRSTDNATIKPIVERLQAQGFRVWIDWDEITVEFNPLFRSRISEGIQLSSFALLFTSINYHDSPYCMEEAAFFAKRFVQTPERIIEVRLDHNKVREKLKLSERSGPLDFVPFRGMKSDDDQYDALTREIVSRLETYRGSS